MFRIFFKRRGVVPNFCKKFGQFLLGTGEDEGVLGGEKGPNLTQVWAFLY